MAAPRLIDLAFSAWSEKARWALDWKGVAYERDEYVPIVGDAALKRRTGQAEVPVLVTESGEAIPDSSRSVAWAEERAPEPRLFPADPRARADAARWQDWAGDSLSVVGRALCTAGMAADSAAARATVPPNAPWIVKATAPLAVPIAFRMFRGQYELTDHAIEHARWRLPRLLETLGGALAGGREFLVGESLSIADIAVAAALILVDPAPDEFLPRPMPAALRKAFTYGPARREFPKVFDWKDRLYQKFRRPSARAPAATAGRVT